MLKTQQRSLQTELTFRGGAFNPRPPKSPTARAGLTSCRFAKWGPTTQCEWT